MQNRNTTIGMPTATYMDGARWIDAHVDELTKKYPNKWIAVHRDRVVAFDQELGRTEDAVDVLIPLDEVTFQFMDDGTLLFSCM